MYKLDKKELEFRREMRGRYSEGLSWYAVMVHWGHEEIVRDWIGEDLKERCVDEVFLPMLQAKPAAQQKRSEAPPEFLFHSYLFLRCAMNDGIYMPICDHSSVFQIMGRAYRIPSVLDEEEILHLKGILQSDCSPEMVDKCNIGDSAEIVQGLMAGIQGRVLAVNSSKVRLEVSFAFLNMGTSVAVVVPRSDVRIKEDCYVELTGERVCYG